MHEIDSVCLSDKVSHSNTHYSVEDPFPHTPSTIGTTDSYSPINSKTKQNKTASYICFMTCELGGIREIL